ncbi:F-box/kelch-repeat protein At1g80440-like [Euphorbia lathyris]|uniref:F-box/kelch-repeat protein At1g80440-like n=1 Tax=Euphorbia lathyris TaxID=212925 RepID=UPI003313BFC2
MELIPGLPYDIARDCLVRATYKQFSTAVSVCKGWRNEIESPEFRPYRKDTSKSQKLVVMAQAHVDRAESSNQIKQPPGLIYRLTLLEPDTGDWCDLPPIPGFPQGLPMFSQVVSVGSQIVVLGGLDPATWEVSVSVYVFDFLTAVWRRGTDMPGVRRSFFGCASDSDRTVFVVGGHDGEKNALKSGLAYDVAKDEWVPLPDMARERDECKAIFHRGKVHVIGGYCTRMQGRFEKGTQALNVATWQWDSEQEEFLLAATCPRTCTGGSEEIYICHGGDVVALRGDTWQAVAKIPTEVVNVAHVTAWQKKVMVIGSTGFGEAHTAYVLDVKSKKWGKVETPKQYSGHVQSGCFVEI